MLRRYQYHLKSFIYLCSFIFVGSTTINAQVVCNKFKIKMKVVGSTLYCSLETDLPGYTDLMVSVSRSYKEKGVSSNYSADYFSEKSNVEKWTSKEYEISIDSDKWRSSLKNKQVKMSRLGIGFEVGSISDKIKVRMVVPINQSNSRFGERNSRLKGAMVKNTGFRIIEDENVIHYPLNSSNLSDYSSPSLDPRALDIGSIYIAAKKINLMPSHSPTDPIGALNHVKTIPRGGMFKVYETFKKNGTPWYRVVAITKTKKRIGEGWINSTALIGQQLELYKDP